MPINITHTHICSSLYDYILCGNQNQLSQDNNLSGNVCCFSVLEDKNTGPPSTGDGDNSPNTSTLHDNVDYIASIIDTRNLNRMETFLSDC